MNLRVERGALVGLVGPNGSGKTTLYRLILGLVSPDEGRIRVGGMEPARYRHRFGVGYLPEQVRLPSALTVGELAELMWALAGSGKDDGGGATKSLLADLGLRETVAVPIGQLSHGYRQRVGLLAALIGDPELTLLDEPANGLDPSSIAILRTTLRRLRRAGRTVLLSSHNLFELERLCDVVVVIRRGHILGQISRQALARQPDVWVVQLDPHRGPLGAELASPLAGSEGVTLAADEVAFTGEDAARDFADRLRSAGGAVETVERRRSDLEFLFHSLLREAARERAPNDHV